MKYLLEMMLKNGRIDQVHNVHEYQVDRIENWLGTNKPVIYLEEDDGTRHCWMTREIIVINSLPEKEEDDD